MLLLGMTMRLLQTTKNTVLHFRDYGVVETFRYAIEKGLEWYHESRLGISTTGKMKLDALGIDNPCSAPYYASDYRTIYASFRHLKITPQDVFLDYGCGMGRILAVAATYPFRRVIGVELSDQLSEMARENLTRAARRLKCQDTSVVNGDATQFPVPPDVSVIFFYNPFHGPVLNQVLGEIRKSLQGHPRPMQIIFKNTTYLEPLLPEHPWLHKQAEFPAYDGDHKVMILKASL